MHIAVNAVVIFGAFFLVVYAIMKGYFIRFIVGVYQRIVEEEGARSQLKPAWRVPTISELLGNDSSEEIAIYNIINIPI